jgi:hypothetical protein
VAFLKEKSNVWKDTVKLETLLGKASEFAGIFYVGGHGRESFSVTRYPLLSEWG